MADEAGPVNMGLHRAISDKMFSDDTKLLISWALQYIEIIS